MINLSELRPEHIRAMSYNELIGVVRETNRTPGGNDSVHYVAARTGLNDRCIALDIGTSTGSTALELARLTGCTVFGIDTNENSLKEARRRASLLKQRRAFFQRQDATALDFADGTFDLVFCGNVISLIEGAEKAFAEFRRVLRTGGYLAAIPMYYVEEPPPDIIEKVRTAIQTPIKVRYRSAAVAFFEHEGLEPYAQRHYRFDRIDAKEVDEFVNLMLARTHLDALTTDSRAALHETYHENMMLFRDNLSYMGFTILLARKSSFIEDPMLFTAHSMD